MPSSPDANALNCVRQLLAERRQSQQSSAATAMVHRRSDELLRGKAGCPPSPSVAAQFLVETNAGAAYKPQQQREDEQANAYWATLAASSEAHVANPTWETCSSLVPPPTQLRPPPPQAPHRISYYAGFLPDVLDRDDMPTAVRTTQWASVDASGEVVPVLPTSEKIAEKGFGCGPVGRRTSYCSTRSAGLDSFVSHRRRTASSANSAGSISGTSASVACTQGVTYDATLAAAMISTSDRMHANQQQQQRRRSSAVTSASVGRRVWSSSEDSDWLGKDALVGPTTTLCYSANSEHNDDEVRGVGAAVRRGIPPSLALPLPEASMHLGHCKRWSTTAAVVGPSGPRRELHGKPNAKEMATNRHSDGSNGGPHVHQTAAAASSLDHQRWWRQSVPLSSPTSSSSVGERERAVTEVNGMRHPLAETSAVFRGNSLVSQPPQIHPSLRNSSNVSTPSPTGQSSRRSTTGSDQLRLALLDSANDAHVVHASNRHGGGGHSSSDAQLSHHQLTEAFYGCFKGGKMAREAYLHFIAQQQQQKQQQQQQHKKGNVLSSASPLTPQ